MAYQNGDKILSAHYNDFKDDVNDVYADNNSGATGQSTGGYGYGQSAVPALSPSTKKVEASEWNTLLSAIFDCANHQGTVLSIPSSVSVGDQITAFDGNTPISGFTTADISAAISSIRTNRFDIDNGNGSVTGSSTSSASGSWDSTRTQTVTASFNSWDEMRYFFNAAGKIRFSFSFTGSSSNTTETNWIAMSNAVEVVSFAYTNTTSSGGVGVSGGGFYDLTSSDQQVYSYIPPGYSSEQYIIEARLDSSPGSATDIIFTISFVTPSGGDVIDLTLNSELAIFDPSDVISVTSPSLSPGSIS